MTRHHHAPGSARVKTFGGLSVEQATAQAEVLTEGGSPRVVRATATAIAAIAAGADPRGVWEDEPPAIRAAVIAALRNAGLEFHDATPGERGGAK